MSSLNETLKNAIAVVNNQTWDQATKLFEDQDSKLKQRAADMIQAEQLLIQYKKQRSEQLKMYPATANGAVYHCLRTSPPPPLYDHHSGTTGSCGAL